jgi:hypothetical protein
MRTVYGAVLVMVCSLSWPLASASAQTLEQRVTALEAKLACVTVQGTELFVTGCNVHIRNGQNATTVKNGTGNLIIGYNEGTHDRSGSHNLVIGPEHTYSSTGGLVAGYGNTLSGVSASVTGGTGNTASQAYASVSGGLGNTAAGRAASVSGGAYNTASGPNTSVSGGEWNAADDADGIGAHGASVSGGRGNHASGPWATVRGGPDYTAATNYALLPPKNSPSPSNPPSSGLPDGRLLNPLD